MSRTSTPSHGWGESVESCPGIPPGARVRTTRENPELASSWTKEAKEYRKWGVLGEVFGYHDSHGLCYDVWHDCGGWATYDPSELEIIL